MARFLRNASPEVFCLVSALIGVVIAAAASRIPGIEMGFYRIFAVFFSADVMMYIAMKAGWLRTPRQRSGIDK